MNEFISCLRFADIGCQLGEVNLGIFVCADNIILLPPSRHSLQFMATISERVTKSHSMKFSTNAVVDKSNTKCLIFTKTPIVNVNISSVFLNNVQP